MTPDIARNESAVPDPRRVADAASALGRSALLVVGDAILDRYVHGKVLRQAQEAPIPVVLIDTETLNAGGAANVVRNAAAIGAAAAFLTVVGDDQAGQSLTGLIGGSRGVEPWILVQGSRTTPMKTRIVAGGTPIVRMDRETTDPIHPKIVERLARIFAEALPACAAVALSDYGKGVITDSLARDLIATARGAGRPVIADPAGSDFERYAGASVLLPTPRELEGATGMSAGTKAEAVAASRAAIQRYGIGAIVVMRGPRDGLLLVTGDPSELPVSAAVPPEPFVDILGANEAVLAALAAAIASGIDLPTAVGLAAHAAAIAMEGFASVTVPAELLVERARRAAVVLGSE